MFDGAVKKLPCTVQDYVFDNFSITSQATVYAGLNTDFNEVTWFYASKSSSFIDRSVSYNYLENVWYTNSLARTTWLDRGVYELPYATEYEPTVNGTVPTVLGLTDGASSVYVHEEGTDDDISAMRCTLQSGDFDIQDGQQILSVSRGIPDFKNQVGAATLTMGFKTYPAQTGTTIDRSVTTSTDFFDLRGRGRQTNVKITSNTLGSDWRYGTLRLDIKPDGGR